MTLADDVPPVPAKSWDSFYAGRFNPAVGRYPTEWVVRTLAGGNYPGLTIDKSRYKRARILDMGCGDGRNLPLLLDLGFEVHATEFSPTVVHALEEMSRELKWPVRFAVGLNSNLPYPDHYFDYMLCCASCYYLADQVSWPQVRTELARVLKPSGLMIANFCDEDNFILRDSVRQEDGSFLITSDPYGLRNGSRFMAARDKCQLTEILSPEFLPLSVGHLNDDYYGIRVSGHIVVARKQT